MYTVLKSNLNCRVIVKIITQNDLYIDCEYHYLIDQYNRISKFTANFCSFPTNAWKIEDNYNSFEEILIDIPELILL